MHLICTLEKSFLQGPGFDEILVKHEIKFSTELSIKTEALCIAENSLQPIRIHQQSPVCKKKCMVVQIMVKF